MSVQIKPIRGSSKRTDTTADEGEEEVGVSRNLRGDLELCELLVKHRFNEDLAKEGSYLAGQ